ncbi:MAG: hypothetical protein ACYSW7_07045 [Planctomycetota bacterium]|jgi:hypothetical protein
MPLKKQVAPRTSTNKKTYSLTIKDTAARGMGFVATLLGTSYEYRKRARLLGGDWSARFNLSGSEHELKNFFLTKIGHHLEQNTGSKKVWEGFIYEMDLSAHGITRRISMTDVRNAVKVKYTDTSGANQETSWYTNAQSIGIYGRIEEIIYLDRVLAATATAEAQTHLAESAFPTPKVVSVKDNDELKLEVAAVGYVYTLNYKFVTAGDGTTKNISTYLADIINTDSEFITVGSIETNTTQVKAEFNTDIRGWDAVVALTEVGDAIKPYIAQVIEERRLIYEALDPEPSLFWNGRTLHKKVGTNLSVNPWTVRPGVMRDLTWTRQQARAGAFLSDLRDVIISEAETAEGYSIPLLKTDEYDDSDFMTALAKELRSDDTKILGNIRGSSGIF